MSQSSTATRRILGWIITLLGAAFIALAGLGAMAGRHAAGDVAGAGWVYAIVVLVGLAGLWAFRKGKQMRVLTAEEQIALDARPPILYLRSFKSDAEADETQAGKASQNVARFAIPQNLASEEEQIALVMNSIGPFVGIGEPGEVLPQLGAARMYVGDDEWQDTIRKYMKESRLVVMRVGDTEGFWWEVENVPEHLSPQKVIFLLPDTEEEYQAFRARAEKHLPRALPGEMNPKGMTDRSFGGILWFEDDWTPHIELCNVALNASTNTVASDLKRILHPVLDRLGLADGPPLASLGRRVGAKLIDIAFLGGLIAAYAFTISLMDIEDDTGQMFSFMAIALFPFIYFGLEGTGLRATPGKKIMGLEVRDKHGVPISFQHALLRFVLTMFELFLWLWVVSLIFLIQGKRSVTDRIAGVQIIRAIG